MEYRHKFEIKFLVLSFYLNNQARERKIVKILFYIAILLDKLTQF